MINLNLEPPKEASEEYEEESDYFSENDNFNNNNLFIFENMDNQNLDFSINDYVSKLRKKIQLIKRKNQNNIIEEKKNNNDYNANVEKKNTALNLYQIPFIKFKINPIETMDEIIYIFSKKKRTINEVIYLQHLLNLFGPKNFLNMNIDKNNLNINEILFNISICLNMRKFNKNEIISKYGDYNDKIFFLLSGGVTLLEPIEKKCYMSIEEYINYLNKLVEIGEYELIRKIIERN